MCGGPLDPWMEHCGPGYGCLGSCCCETAATLGNLCCSGPVCPPPVCAPVCPAPICPPACPAPICPPAGMPWGSMPTMPTGAPLMPMPAAPFATPGMYSPAPVPTFAEPCASCNQAGISGSPQVYGTPYANAGNYSQLFHAPPLAPPAQPYGDQFLMPTPLDQSTMPPAPSQMPPHYEEMDTPAQQQPMPATMPPMNTTNPMPQAAPMNTQPMPMNAQPMPMGPGAMNSAYPQIMVPTMMQQGVAHPNHRPYIDSRRHEANHMRL